MPTEQDVKMRLRRRGGTSSGGAAPVAQREPTGPPRRNDSRGTDTGTNNDPFFPSQVSSTSYTFKPIDRYNAAADMLRSPLECRAV